MTSSLLVVLQSGGADIPRYTAQQRLLAVLAVLVLIGAGLWLRMRWGYAGLEDDQSRHKAALLQSKSAVSPVSLRIPATRDLGPHREGLRELIAAARAGETPSTEPPTLIGAVRETHASVGSALRERFSGLSQAALTIGETALLVIVLGSIAVSTDAVVALIRGGPSGLDVGHVVSTTVDLTVSVLAAGTDLLFEFPFVDIIWALLLTLVILAVPWIYERWELWAVLLFAFAAAVAVLDRRVTEDVEPAPGQPVERTSMVFGAIVLTWLAGVVPATLGELAGASTLGAVIGFFAAFGMAGYWIQRGIRRIWYRIKRGARRHAGADGEGARLLAAYLSIRRAGLSLAAGVTPLLVIYLVVIVVTGRGMRVVDAVAAAPLETKALVLLAALLVATGVAWVVRQAEADVRSGLAGALSLRAVRVAVFARGMPLGFAALGALIGYTFGNALLGDRSTALIAAAILGLLFGIVGRLAYVAFVRARHRIELFRRREPVPTSLLVEAFVLTDDDGTEHLFVRLNGSRSLAWSDADEEEVVATVVDVGEQLAVDGDADPTVAEWRARDLLEFGIVDPEDTWAKLKRLVHEQALNDLLREEWTVDRGTFDEAIDDIPEEVREAKEQEWKRHSVIVERGGEVVLKHDPHAG